MSETRLEPVRARPWRSDDGPEPAVQTWPRADQPALWVWSKGRWRWSTVLARHDWPDGRVAYQVAVDLDGSTTVRIRTYWWPHEGLRVARRTAAGPSATRPAGSRRGTINAGHDTVDVAVLQQHHQLLRELGVIDADRLRTLPLGQTVLVAGVRVATQTPPLPSRARELFATLADASGLVDIAFTVAPHETHAQTVFHTALLVVLGALEEHGGHRTVIGENVWNLEEIAAHRAREGLPAVQELLAGAIRGD